MSIRPLPSILRALFLSILFASVGHAQQAAPSPHAQKLRERVQTMEIGSKVSVLFAHEQERYGTLTAVTDSTFSFHDVDDNTDRTVSYEDITKIRAGYGGYNSLRHRHTDHTRALIIGGIVIGGLLTLAIFAARS